VRGNAVAYVALFFALAGGAYASGALAPANSVNSQAIINGQVKRADLANGAVSASKVAPNSLTGAQINESSLGTVPSAGNATHLAGAPASDYAKAVTINGDLLGSTPTKVVSVRGLTLSASCNAGSMSSITVTAVSNSGGRFEINYTRTSDEHATPAPTESGLVLTGGASPTTVLYDHFTDTTDDNADGGGTFVYSPMNEPGAVTGIFHYYMQKGVGGECDFLGNAVPSP